ncbi:MAG: hypothetical protein IT453_05810 [Planctomycetes bacterium]|nr:hypothetical protein [Planctomycetota bacterium]
MNEALERALHRRLLFTFTTGRSGTDYLARALGSFARVHAEHEPKPTFASAWRTVLAHPETAREFWLEHKLPRIARSHAPIYAETSHLACKGFLESLIELGALPTVLHLVRPSRDVARSLWTLGTVPGRTFKGVKYYHSPDDPRVLLATGGAHRTWHDYQLCYWYCLETEARAQRFRARFEPLGVRVERVAIAQLTDAAGIRRLGDALDLGSFSTRGRIKLLGLTGRATNRKLAAKRPVALPDDELARLEGEVERAVASAAGQSTSK